jgi:hypothetical protein
MACSSCLCRPPGQTSNARNEAPRPSNDGARIADCVKLRNYCEERRLSTLEHVQKCTGAAAPATRAFQAFHSTKTHIHIPIHSQSQVAPLRFLRPTLLRLRTWILPASLCSFCSLSNAQQIGVFWHFSGLVVWPPTVTTTVQYRRWMDAPPYPGPALRLPPP